MTTIRSVSTSHGTLAVLDQAGAEPAVVFIHGNSSCKEVFRHQFTDPALMGRRLLALDLPGHGKSEDARNPQRTYWLGGFAEAVVEALNTMKIGQPVVVGWSLGGHVALEMIPRLQGMRGLMIMGTPPVRMIEESFRAAFVPSDAMALTGKNAFTEDDVRTYVRYTCGPTFADDPHLLAMCARTDGKARSFTMNSASDGRALDEVALVEIEAILLGVVNGANDPFVNLSYVDQLRYRNVWEGAPITLQHLGHAPFLEAPAVFNPVLVRFVAAIAKQHTGSEPQTFPAG